MSLPESVRDAIGKAAAAALMEGRKGYCQGNEEKCSNYGGEGRESDGRCPLFGTLLKPSRDGQRRVKGCGDPVARGKRNRAKGDAKARKARKVLGLEGPNTRHEEHLRGPVLTEAKAGKQVGPIWTRFQAARAQAEESRAIGDHRPFVMTAHPDGTSEWLVIVSSKDWDQVMDAYREAE